MDATRMTFEPFDPSELAEIMRRLASEQGLLRALAHGARHTKVRTAADNAREMRELYAGALREDFMGSAKRR